MFPYNDTSMKVYLQEKGVYILHNNLRRFHDEGRPPMWQIFSYCAHRHNIFIRKLRPTWFISLPARITIIAIFIGVFDLYPMNFFSINFFLFFKFKRLKDRKLKICFTVFIEGVL